MWAQFSCQPFNYPAVVWRDTHNGSALCGSDCGAGPGQPVCCFVASAKEHKPPAHQAQTPYKENEAFPHLKYTQGFEIISK